MILTGPKQRETLVQWMESAREDDQIDLISPWISKDSLQVVLEARKPGMKVNIVTRFPSSTDELSFTDWAALRSAQADNDKVTVSVVDDPGRLHAKVYRVGQQAIVTSANLTESGLSADSEGNIELGVCLQSPEDIKALTAWIDDLDPVPLNDKRFGDLIERRKAYQSWYSKAEKAVGPMPSPPPNPSLGSDMAAGVINDLLVNGEIRDASRVDGYGVRAFELDINSRKPRYRVKAVTSQARTSPVSGVAKEFHFELRVDVLKEWKKKKDPIHGVVLVPYEKNERNQDVLLCDPSPCFLPFSFLFEKKNLPFGKFVKGRTGSDLTPT